MLRGTGARGLAGIASRNGRIVRPLLFATREDIEIYAAQNEIPFRVDSSNMSMKHLRNRVRHEVVPMLKEINPQFTSIMQRNMTHLGQAQSFIDAAMAIIKRTILTESRGVYSLDIAAIDASMPRNFVIYEILNSEFGFRREVVSDICTAIDNGATGRRFLASDRVAVVDRYVILIMPIAEDNDVEISVDCDTTSAMLGDMQFTFDTLDRKSIETLNQGAYVALIDADKVSFPLTIRRWREGDTMVPFGMTGRKKISDMLIDAKVSLADKREQYVLLSGGDVAWLVGRRIDNRYAVKKETSRVLRVTISR
jgi:tRNA(Ile)-lysidine synthase